MTQAKSAGACAQNRPKNAAQPWFVAQTKPNGFATAQANLARQGFKTFMPMQGRTTRHARKEHHVWRPLFPGYIFISFDPTATQWRVINSTFGVQTLVSANRIEPQRVPAAMIQALLQGCDPKGRILPPLKLGAGDKVRILRGPFQDVLAEVQAATEQARVRLLFDLMGRAVVAECLREDLEVLHA